MLLYCSGRLVVVRDLDKEKKVQAFVYRGHAATVTAARFAPSGCYVASADARGKLRVWSYDNQEHLCKLDLTALSGPIRDISWDMDSKRVSLSKSLGSWRRSICCFCCSLFVFLSFLSFLSHF